MEEITRPINILVIEDDSGDARLIKEMLSDVRGRNINLQMADRLSKSAEYLSERSFDIILLDLSLPDSRGLETFVAVYDRAQTVPIIILSGQDDETVAIKAVQAGAQDYLVKGQVDGVLLVRSINYAIERKKMEDKLKNKMNELKKFNKVAVGRELKMRELKTRIKELEDKLRNK